MSLEYINQDLTLKYFEPNIIDTPNGLFADGNGGVVKNRNNIEITQIIIHFTAGWGAKTSVSHWKNRVNGGGSVATPFIIEGNISKKSGSNEGEKDISLSNGQIYKVYENYESKWTHHVGKDAIHKRSIGIEIANLGHLRKEQNEYYFEPSGGSYKINLLDNEIEVESYSVEYRGKKYFHKINNEQIISLKELLVYLAQTYNISMANTPENIGVYNQDVENGVAGIYSHANVVQSGKWDWHPQPELLSLLLELDNYSKAITQFNSLKNSLSNAAKITSGNKDALIASFLDKVIGFYIKNGNSVFPLRSGIKTMKKFSNWISINQDIFKEYPDFPEIDTFFPNLLVPFVKEKFYELIMDKVYRIYGYLSAAKYKEYYERFES